MALGTDTTRAATYAFGFFAYVVGELGITAGAHRLWSHRSYNAAGPLRVLLLLLTSSEANQGSAICYSRDHLKHHLFSDTMATRGTWTRCGTSPCASCCRCWCPSRTWEKARGTRTFLKLYNW